ncbi:MAG TPA: GTPase HflX, partial [Nitrosarchaeum sp.]|nr:GTPase HflX [Nitrosarchaeum sp.]
PEEIEEKIEILNLKDHKKRITISAKTGHNLIELKNLIKAIIQNQKLSEYKKETSIGFDNTYGN